MAERTIVVFKPDSVERGLVGEILSRFERAGLRIVGSKTLTVTEEFVSHHYPDRSDLKPDSVERGLVGEILSRFERAGLRIVGSKTITVTEEFVSHHYPDKTDFLRSMGMKTLENRSEQHTSELRS